MEFNPNAKASRYFTYRDLIVTSTGIDNTPDDEDQINNLATLGALLDELNDAIGPFTVNSAFRSAAVNAAVGGVSDSLHGQGLAADLIPLGDTIDGYFVKLLHSPLRSHCGEIILKRPQGSLHISTPTWNKCGRAMELTSDGVYRTFTGEEMAQFSDGDGEPLVPSLSLLACEESQDEIVKASAGGAGILLVGAALAFAIQRWRSLK